MCACSQGPKALYTIVELAELSGQSRFAIARLLARNEVHLERSGRKRYVPIAALRAALPWLVDSVGQIGALHAL